ncbi:MAG: magnesium-translocating P-type ATPase [Raoultibacter sp.]
MKKLTTLTRANEASTVRSSILDFANSRKTEEVLDLFGTTAQGLTRLGIEQSRDSYGSNVVDHVNSNTLLRRLIKAFVNPFTCILIILATVSGCTDILFTEPGEADATTVTIITTMVLISGALRFVQETRSGNAAARLAAMINNTTCVVREGCGAIEIPFNEVVAGDLVKLAAGDLVPADLLLLQTKDLFVNESSLTGESEPAEKRAELKDLACMGSTIVSGSAVGIVILVGNDTLLGSMAKTLSVDPPKTSFEQGVSSVSWVLIRFMLVMVPIVLFINGFTKGDWMGAALFALSVAVGLTPEMLPTIVTACLAKGAVALSKKKVVIKNLDAIQNLGSIDVLCCDKTGTLTQDQVALERYLDVDGNEDSRVLRHAFLNSFYQTGLKNLMDKAIVRRVEKDALEQVSLRGLEESYTKVDEIPFDFERRRMSVVVQDLSGKTQMVTKGALEEMLCICSHVEIGKEVLPLTPAMRDRVLQKTDALNAEGMRVLAVAQKTDPRPVGEFFPADEAGMVLIGYLAFLDPPKESATEAICALHHHGVVVKVLTGDNDKVAASICRQVGIKVGNVVLGERVETMDDDCLRKVVEQEHVFAKLSPAQKARVVTALRENGHTVGFMGDGINDAAAMHVSDVGISVDTAVDIAKESANVILLEKDLMVLERGIVEGRRTYANMIKYIKMTASSNFGNMFSVLAASAFLPFLPMMSIQLILLNLIYDLSCAAIPWDNVDGEFLERPQKWDAKSVGKFMVWIGPTSSVFDITTYLLMFFVICPMVVGMPFDQITDPASLALFIATFQAGWFTESMWSQTLVIHMIRTPKIPFLESRASLPVTLLTFTGIAVLTSIPFSPAAEALGLAPLPIEYYGFLLITIICYMVLATIMKKVFVRRYGSLL